MVNESTDRQGKNSINCSICSQLSDEEYAYQKYGWEENNTYLPPEWNLLILVKDIKPAYDSRTLRLFQCPECGLYYLYRTDYEYLVNGTEDEEFLTRLTKEEAAGYLSGALGSIE